MTVVFTRRYHFSASHRLDCAALSAEQNREVYGKCNNPHGHGHNYRVEVSVRGPIDPATGMVMNMADLDALVDRSVVERFHLANLNVDPLFEREVPTTENLCRAIHRLLAGELPQGRLDRIRIEETENNFLSSPGRLGVNKGRRAVARAGATIEAMHTVGANNGTQAEGLERYSTQQIYAELLARFDEDPTRDGLQKTPERVEKAMTFLTQGYHQDPQEILRSALFDVDYDEMVMVKDIEMFSLCEHHMLPFFGKVHIAYIPKGKVVGLSKLPRLVDVFARRLQVQERMTREIAHALQEAIAPQGVGVVVEARHLCMMMRGVEKQNSSTVTSSMSGVFLEDKTRAEFLSLVRDHARSSY